MKSKTLACTLVAALVLVMFAGCTRGGDVSSSNPSTSSEATSSEPVSSSEPTITSSTPSAPSPGEDNNSYDDSRATLSTDFAEIGALSGESVLWGPGVRKNAEGRSEACDMLQNSYGDLGALFIGENEPTVYLTFDQGYENGYTAAILDVLKEKDAKAVFFLTGHYIKSAPELVQRMIDEGHVLGNHSYNHPNYSTIAIEDAFSDMNRLHEDVYNTWGVTMNLFRFPEGAFSERSLGLVQSTGYTSVFWSFAYNDWNPEDQMDPSVALQRVFDGAHNGCIFLFHTVGETNSLILGDVIDGLREQGYTIGTLGADSGDGAGGDTERAWPDEPDRGDAASSPSENFFLRP